MREHKTTSYVTDQSFKRVFWWYLRFLSPSDFGLRNCRSFDVFETKDLYHLRGMVAKRFFVPVSNSKSDFSYLTKVY